MKKKTKIHIQILIYFCFLIAGRSQETPIIKRDYKVVLEEGIYVEKFDSTNTSENRYTANNQTYLEGNQYVYDYYYEDLNGKSKY